MMPSDPNSHFSGRGDGRGRVDGRAECDIRPVTIRRGVSPYAEGSVEITAGRTKVLITASVELEVPPWMKPRPDSASTPASGTGGWITAEYGMLPRATHSRNRREAALGKQGGRTLEIQRLIGRALRAAVDIKQLPPVTIRFDCDVINADGGTRTLAISGGWIALHDAVRWIERSGLPAKYGLPSADVPLPLTQVAAISVGVVKGHPLVDLCYDEDSQADFDLNVVLEATGNIIEVQGTAERQLISRSTLSTLLDRAEGALATIFALQRAALESPLPS